MLYAIDNNKAGINFSGTEINWRKLFATSEDSLLSSVMGNLLHLPEKHFWEIIYAATNCRLFLNEENTINEASFWPSWDSAYTSNSKRVEPDLLLRTSKFDLIIEAKRENCIHFHEQWKNECQAYCNEYGNSSVPVVFLALGGIIEFRYIKDDFAIADLEITTCTWQQLLYTVQSKKETIEISGQAERKFLLRVLHDVIVAFRIHGFYHIEWLSTLAQSRFLALNEASTYFFEQLPALPTSPSLDFSKHRNIQFQSIDFFQTPFL